MLGPQAFLVLPTLSRLPPTIESERTPGNRLTLPVNLAGLPALAIPIPTASGFPASLQIVGPPNGEELLLAVGSVLEAAVA